MIKRDRSKDEWQFLANVGTSYELELITSILAQEGILVMKKSKGSGAYTDVIMGTSLTGYDIYVPMRNLLQAREILQNMPVFEEEEIDYTAQDEPVSDDNSLLSADRETERDGFLLRNKERFKLLFFVFIIIPILLGLAIAMFH